MSRGTSMPLGALPQGSQTTVRVEQWARLSDEYRGELVCGALVDGEASSYVHEVTLTWLMELLLLWCRAHGARVVGSGLRYVLTKDTGRSPDLSVFLAGCPRPRLVVPYEPRPASPSRSSPPPQATPAEIGSRSSLSTLPLASSGIGSSTRSYAAWRSSSSTTKAAMSTSSMRPTARYRRFPVVPSYDSRSTTCGASSTMPSPKLASRSILCANRTSRSAGRGAIIIPWACPRPR